jgi:hypothetical protein
MSTYHDAFIAEAVKWIGIKEVTGNNDGVEVQMFQKAVDGKAQGEPWCMGFVQFCLQKTEASLNIRTNVFHSELCRAVWNKTPEKMHSKEPKAGFIVIWQHGTTQAGHTGIVTEVLDGGQFSTIEGNTGNGTGVVREGDGVYRKTRSTKGSGDMTIMGFIDPFAEVVNG